MGLGQDLLGLDRTEARENSYPNLMSKLLGGFAVEAVKADAMAKDATLARTITILKRPNVSWNAGGTVLGSDEKLVAGASVPAVMLSDVRSFAPSTAKIAGSMRTSESNKAVSNEKGSGTFSATTKWGIGLFSVSGTVGGSMSSSSKQTRTTDYSSKVDWEMNFSQGPPPEGVSLIVETTTTIINKLMQINVARADAKAQELADKADDNPSIPDTDDDDTDDGGDTGGGDGGDDDTTDPQEESGDDA